MAEVTIKLDTNNPEDLAIVLRAFGAVQGEKTLTLDTAKKTRADKVKPEAEANKPEGKAEETTDDDAADALNAPKVDREACVVLARTKTGVKDLLAKFEAKDGKLSNIPDAQLGEFYNLCKALPNK